MERPDAAQAATSCARRVLWRADQAVLIGSIARGLRSYVCGLVHRLPYKSIAPKIGLVDRARVRAGVVTRVCAWVVAVRLVASGLDLDLVDASCARVCVVARERRRLQHDWFVAAAVANGSDGGGGVGSGTRAGAGRSWGWAAATVAVAKRCIGRLRGRCRMLLDMARLSAHCGRCVHGGGCGRLCVGGGLWRGRSAERGVVCVRMRAYLTSSI
jgi:hypothetical protein